MSDPTRPNEKRLSKADRRSSPDRRDGDRSSDLLPLLGAFGPLVTGAALLSPPSEVSYGVAMLGALVSSMALFSLTRTRTEAITSAQHFSSQQSEAERVRVSGCANKAAEPFGLSPTPGRYVGSGRLR